MFKIFFSFSLLLSLTCLSQTNRSFEINGFIENKSTGKISLYCYDEKGNFTNNTSEIKGNRFYFKGSFPERAKAALAIDGLNITKSFFIDTGKINIHLKIDSPQVSGNTAPSFSITKITGSQSQKIWEETMDHFGKISRCEAPDSVKSEDYYNAMLLLAKEHPELYVTRELLRQHDSWSYEQLKNIFDAIPKAQQETQLGARIKKQLALLKETKPNTYLFFPTQKDTQGKQVTLDDLAFKYLLIDFWASWCAPCRREHPGLVKLYNRYKPSGFEVLSISLDKQTDKANWLQAIKGDKLPWKQVSDLKGFNTEIATHYSLEYIPYNILIDRAGKILATDLRGDDLAKKIKELFSATKNPF